MRGARKRIVTQLMRLEAMIADEGWSEQADQIADVRRYLDDAWQRADAGGRSRIPERTALSVTVRHEP